MGPMRQRLLLVAGWVAAAVVATLVSTGAVAVAGGQVTDRPLPPLSASEVAALTEECGPSDRAPCLRQLEGSVEPSTTVAVAPETSSPKGDGQGVSPDSAELPLPLEDDALDPDESPVSPVGEDDVPEPRSEVVSLRGATVSISGAAGEILVIWAIPSPGFALIPLADSGIDDDSLMMVFSDGSHRSTLTARWDETEGLVIGTTEGQLP